jgi:hypothetical protein
VALTQRQQQGVTTRSAENSPVMIEFYKNDPDFGPGVVGGDASQIREKYAEATRKVWPQTNRGGQGVTTTDSLKTSHFTCAKCGAETALLVEQTGRPGRHHAVCIQCAGVPSLGATIPAEGDAPLPKGRERLEPTYALTED